jgi:tripartite-type tricarboxylate transporter receptor subunit TctC
VVHPSVPARNLQEVIELTRSRPGQISFGSDSIGGTSHLAGELFNLMAKTKMVHVPFKGGGESAMATAAGQVQVNFPSKTSALPMLKAGKFRALAVTSLTRSSLLPDVPTLDELGLKGFDLVAWFGFVGPPGMPRPLVDKLNVAINKVAQGGDIKESVSKQGMEVQIGSPEQFGTYMRTLGGQISRLGKEANIKLE